MRGNHIATLPFYALSSVRSGGDERDFAARSKPSQPKEPTCWCMVAVQGIVRFVQIRTDFPELAEDVCACNLIVVIVSMVYVVV